MSTTAVAQVTRTAPDRDHYLDLLRGFSLVVVVVWHWGFQLVTWEHDGPEVTSPLQYTYSLWPLTWLLQVMPLFFFVGGFAHQLVWTKVREHGGGYGVFVGGRLVRLLVPALVLVGLWLGIAGVIALFVGEAPWLPRTIVTILSPLWFLGVYLFLILIAPLMLSMHERTGVLGLVVLAGCAWVADMLRFAQGIHWTAWINFILVWGFCHQLGFFYSELATLERRAQATLVAGGGLALLALVVSGVYPASMVGVPTDEFSNMGPPTICIVALCVFQVGIAMLARSAVLRWLERPRPTTFNELLNRLSMPLFLFHTTALAMFAVVVVRGAGYMPPHEPTVIWWLQRPLWIIGPMLLLVPILWVFSRKDLDYAFDSLRCLIHDVRRAESRF